MRTMVARVSWPRRFAWGLYDLANTIFSMNVISLYFPVWVAMTFARGEIWYAAAYSLSMLVCMILSPFAGAAGDRIGHKKILFGVTALAICMTLLLGSARTLPAALLSFAIANLGFQLGLVAYNALLPSISDERDRGRVSGLGVALGYIGSFSGMLIALPFVDPAKFAGLPAFAQKLVEPLMLRPFGEATTIVRENAFVPTAILFALFAVPLFLFVRETTPRAAGLAKQNLVAGIRATLRQVLRERSLRSFYISTFLYMDAVHTVYIVMATYASQGVGLSQGEIVSVMSTAILTAVAGSFLYGWTTDRMSRRAAIYLVIGNWVAALLLAAAARDFTQFLLAAIVAGVGLGGVEVVGRVALLSLIPDEERGRFLGFFNLTGKASSIVGPWLWGGTLLLLESHGQLRYRAAVLVLLLPTLLSLWFVRGIAFERGPALRT
jgi:MFS transporter, UMF1 family